MSTRGQLRSLWPCSQSCTDDKSGAMHALSMSLVSPACFTKARIPGHFHTMYASHQFLRPKISHSNTSCYRAMRPSWHGLCMDLICCGLYVPIWKGVCSTQCLLEFSAGAESSCSGKVMDCPCHCTVKLYNRPPDMHLHSLCYPMQASRGRVPRGGGGGGGGSSMTPVRNIANLAHCEDDSGSKSLSPTSGKLLSSFARAFFAKASCTVPGNPGISMVNLQSLSIRRCGLL